MPMELTPESADATASLFELHFLIAAIGSR